ncbi:WbqC family protein [Algoriphagus sediminis]|uniref:WbqC family protein n=1 Tax=Algoriphagus sediminis TaxID=3057113 RepID=A0ABT7YGM0_9BACT|nr:WbqC family protein [Algoriphagus sediminis]MDN3205671.1 WbqC family protein [Algoriphagus sediminis]
MAIVAADLFYFPNLEFFTAIYGFEEIALFPKAYFRRNSYINRTEIRGANKVQRLSIPIQGRRPAIPQEELMINFHEKWQLDHFRTIQSAYGKAPFFEHYFPYFQGFLENPPESLWNLNKGVLTVCLKLLGLSAKVAEYPTLHDFRPEKDLRGQISSNETWQKRGLYSPEPYFQLFGSDFEPNLSILDLLFCMGPEAKMIIESSAKKTLNNR